MPERTFCALRGFLWAIFLDLSSRHAMPTEIRYTPVNQCVYCGAINCVLADEHIIPFSLAGDWVLPKASCKACERITHQFEYTCARQMFGNMRMKYKLPTRRPKERLTHIPLTLSDEGGLNPRTIMLPVGEHPAPIVMYKFDEALIVQGMPPGSDKLQFIPVVISHREELDAISKQHGGRPTFQFKVVAHEFARLIAKIAHCYAVTHVGLRGFRPLLTDVILGRSNDYAYCIGGSLGDVPPSEPLGNHIVSLEFFINPIRSFVIVHIRLFAGAQTPIYYAVAGELDMQNSQHLFALGKQMQNNQSVELPLSFRQTLPRLRASGRIEKFDLLEESAREKLERAIARNSGGGQVG